MAKVKLNPTIEAIHGKIGNLVYKTFNQDEIVARMPDRTGVVPTPNQVAQQSRFRLAALYGKSVMADPVSKQLYEDAAAQSGQAVFALAVADFLNPPAIDEIDLGAYNGKIGDTIKIRASDELTVQSVQIAIRDSGGATVEEGAATWSNSTATWDYVAKSNLTVGQSVSIEVSATDRPGHKTTRTQAKN